MPIIKIDQLPWSEIAHELVGADHGWHHAPLRRRRAGARPHAAPASLRGGSHRAGGRGSPHARRRADGAPRRSVIVLPDPADSFVNSGHGRLRQIDIHLSPSFSTEWLEDRDEEGEDA